MDSIQKNQPEDTKANLTGTGAAHRIKEIAEDAENCFFCTGNTTGETQGVRPMSIRKVDEEGNLWFLSASDSHKNQEVQADPKVRVYLQATKHSGFIFLDGTASISRDRQRIDDLWDPILKTWFTEGKDDPRVTVIKFTPNSGYYWDNKHGNFIAGTKMVIGAAIGKTLDDSIEGKLQP